MENTPLEAKLLKDTEMLDIIQRAVLDSEIDDRNQYADFLKELGSLICNHFGGVPGELDHENDGIGWAMQFHHNDCIPDDGGIFAKYHSDVSWVGDSEEVLLTESNNDFNENETMSVKI